MNDSQAYATEQSDSRGKDRRFSIAPSRRRPFSIGWRKALSAVAAVLAVLLLVALLRPPLVQEQLWTGMVQVGDLNLSVSGFGKLAPVDLITLSAPAGGTVETVHAQVGAKLVKGDPIITLRSPEIREQLATAEHKHAEMLAEHARLQLDFSMRKADLLSQMANAQDAVKIETNELAASARLNQEGLISPMQFARQQIKVASTQRQLDQSRTNLQAFETEEHVRTAAAKEILRLEQADYAYSISQFKALTLRAPESGILLDLPDTLTSGAPVTSGMVLAKLSTRPTLGAEIMIPANQAATLTPGLPVEVYAENRQFVGKLLRITPQAQRDQVKVYASLGLAGIEGFLPGQAITAEIITGRVQGCIYIQKPAQAVENSMGILYEVDRRKGLLYRRDVRFGTSSGRFLVVASGLSPGREVVLGDLSQYRQHRTLRFLP